MSAKIIYQQLNDYFLKEYYCKIYLVFLLKMFEYVLTGK